MSTNAIVLNLVSDQLAKAVYVHWDGGDHLSEILNNHYVNNSERLDDLFSDGYASDVFSDKISRNNTEPKIELKSRDEIELFIDSKKWVNYIHVIKDGAVYSFSMKKTSTNLVKTLIGA